MDDRIEYLTVKSDYYPMGSHWGKIFVWNWGIGSIVLVLHLLLVEQILTGQKTFFGTSLFLVYSILVSSLIYVLIAAIIVGITRILIGFEVSKSFLVITGPAIFTIFDTIILYLLFRSNLEMIDAVVGRMYSIILITQCLVSYAVSNKLFKDFAYSSSSQTEKSIQKPKNLMTS